MKIINANQIREADRYTIQNEPIASIDLMERAALAFVHWFENQFPDTGSEVLIACGTGNNGGDGLAIARLLHQRFYPVQVWLCKISETLSSDCQVNLERLPPHQAVGFLEIQPGHPYPALPSNGIVIDALWGSGLNRPVEGYWAGLLEYLSGHQGPKVAVDLPSGLFADVHSSGMVFRADYTCTFELPKLAFFLPENQRFVGSWSVVSIGLHPAFIQQLPCTHFYTDFPFVKTLIRKRSRFAHKGQFGHALLICGSYGMIGAAVLGSKACLRSGVGLLTVHTPRCGYVILQSTVPEAMADPDRHELYWTESPATQHFDAVGVGCGIGKQPATLKALTDLMHSCKKPMVIDADALNLIAASDLHSSIPPGSILTPHPKEFERLFGPSANDFERLKLQLQKAKEHQCVIILKGAFSAICTPDGRCFFNSTGNPGMATAGSGDVLTGILTGILAQGYAPEEAAVLGTFLHGLAGDIAAEKLEHESLLAGDLVENLGAAFHTLKQHDS